MIIVGVLTLALQSYQSDLWVRCKAPISLVLSVLAVSLLVMSTQPYAAIFSFVLLIIKSLALIKIK